MDIRISGLMEDSIVDGPGLRLAVFTQGCTRDCPGCHNPATHDLLGGSLMQTGDIIRLLQENPLQTGLTLSGGEPFLQPQACILLAQATKALGKNVWAYTGYRYEELNKHQNPACRQLLQLLDVLVDGPFVLSLRNLKLPYRGSENQRLVDVQKSLEAGQVVCWKEEA